MTEDEDPEIAAALAKLAGQDAAAADDARAALEWIAGEQGRTFISQERIQNFCWYELPVKWFVDLDEKLRITAALAQALDLLQLPRYAAICRSQTRHRPHPDWQPQPRVRPAERRPVLLGLLPPAADRGRAVRDSRTGEPPGERDVSWAIHATSNLCRALGLLAVGSDWSDRSNGLTDTGQATALEALRARATGSRTISWP